jgi:transcription antitermination factor NusG
MPILDLVRGTEEAGACAAGATPAERRTLPHWFALRVRSNFEFRVQGALDALDIASFLPAWTETVKWSDREKRVTRPLFPGYAFIRSECREDLLAALRVAGVVQILPNSFNPLPVSEKELNDVRRVVAHKLHAEPCEFVSGELVEIQSGPLAGVRGVVQRTKGAVHVVVSIEMLRRSIRVEVDADTLLRYSEEE